VEEELPLSNVDFMKQRGLEDVHFFLSHYLFLFSILFHYLLPTEM